MTVETCLRAELGRAAAQLDPDPGDLGAVMRLGARRRRLRLVGITAAALVVVGAGSTAAWMELSSGAPTAGQPVVAERDVAIFLCDERDSRCQGAATDADIDALRDALLRDPEVLVVRYESRQEAYDRFVERFAHEPDLVAEVEPPDLRASLRVTVVEGLDAEAFLHRYQRFDGVDVIQLENR